MTQNMYTEPLPGDTNILALIDKEAREDDILLAHALDGVIWGRLSGDRWITSHDINEKVSPPLMVETLQQVRLFNAERELYLWRTPGGWSIREIKDDALMEEDYYDETHILWGTRGKKHADGFTLLTDGAQGLRHILPIPADHVNEKNVRPVLQVRHYFGEDAIGVNYIIASRLVGIEVNTYDAKR